MEGMVPQEEHDAYRWNYLTAFDGDLEEERLRHKENEIQHSSTKSWSGWQRRTASLTTTGRQSGKSSPSEEFPSPGVPWCGLEIKQNLLAFMFSKWLYTPIISLCRQTAS